MIYKFEFIRQLSSDPKNTVVALVRDKETTEKKIADELGVSNITVVQADITDSDALKATFDIVSKATNGGLDYIIANAAKMSYWSGRDDVEDLVSADPKLLDEDMVDMFRINVVGNAHLFNIFLPLIRNGRAKKVIAISTGLADQVTTKNLRLTLGYPYAISKAALNSLIVKFHAQYVDEGILFLAVCPGTVDTGHQMSNMTEKQMKNMMALGAAFRKYQPNFTGPAAPADAVRDVLKTIENATIEKDGGEFVSHFGNKQWL